MRRTGNACERRWPASGRCWGLRELPSARRRWCCSSLITPRRGADAVVPAVATVSPAVLDEAYGGHRLLRAGGGVHQRVCLAREAGAGRGVHQQERDMAGAPAGRADRGVFAQRRGQLRTDLSDGLCRKPGRDRYPPAAFQPPDAPAGWLSPAQLVQPYALPRHQRRELDPERRVRHPQRPLPARPDIPDAPGRGVLSELAVDVALDCRGSAVGLSHDPLRQPAAPHRGDRPGTDGRYVHGLAGDADWYPDCERLYAGSYRGPAVRQDKPGLLPDLDEVHAGVRYHLASVGDRRNPRRGRDHLVRGLSGHSRRDDAWHVLLVPDGALPDVQPDQAPGLSEQQHTAGARRRRAGLCRPGCRDRGGDRYRRAWPRRGAVLDGTARGVLSL